MSANTIVQGLWIGSRLSTMERLSIQSFLNHGHAFHLYVYSDVSGLPAGASLKDANSIIPFDKIFRATKYNSYAPFADLFRYTLLLRNGGWWSDLDVVCLKHFDFAEDHVFAAEDPSSNAREVVTNCVMKAPPRAAVLEYIRSVAQSKDPCRLQWTEIGSELLNEALPKFSLAPCIKPARTFCPVPFFRWKALIESPALTFPPETYALHLWHEQWRRVAMDTDANYDPECLYEQLKRSILNRIMSPIS